MKIKKNVRLLSALALFGGFITSGVAFAQDAGAQSLPTANQHALFIETDSPSGNSILSYLRGSDGTISLAGTYPTGGLGAAGANSSAAPLGSQDGLVLVNSGQELIATNAGSDTVSLFDVSGTQLKLVQKIASGGQFPNSISSHGEGASKAASRSLRIAVTIRALVWPRRVAHQTSRSQIDLSEFSLCCHHCRCHNWKQTRRAAT